MTTLIKAKDYIDQNLDRLIKECAEISVKAIPFLKVVLVGDNPASLSYVRNKKALCEKVGAKCEIVHLDTNISAEDFSNKIMGINNDNEVHGCIIQLPIPHQLKKLKIYEMIKPVKDVDGFGSFNVSKIYKNQVESDSLISCTPRGIMNLLKFYKIEISGKRVVILGRSHIVGKPLFHLMTNEDATVTLCHSKTKNLKTICKSADILISAIGKHKLINSEFIHKEMTVIDVGISLDEHGKISGDVDFDDVKEKVATITPVPGGVGPMTVFSLVENLLITAKSQIYEN